MARDRRAGGAAWHLYVLRTAAGALYTGIAVDVERRLEEHRGGNGRGAKALRGKGPLELVYARAIGPRGLATRAEQRLKRLPKAAKERLVDLGPSAAALLERLELEPAEDGG